MKRSHKAARILSILAIVSTGLSQTPPKPQSEFLSLALSFEANHGQTDPAVKFLSRGDGYALFLTPDSAVFKLRSVPGTSSPEVVRMKLAGANSSAKISGAQTLPGAVNYFIGNDPNKWTTNVSTFGRVTYRQIYPGIDLVYYGTQRQLEYDFIVAPGADPKQINLEFAGAKPTLGPQGNLALTARWLSAHFPQTGDLSNHRRQEANDRGPLQTGRRPRPICTRQVRPQPRPGDRSGAGLFDLPGWE